MTEHLNGKDRSRRLMERIGRRDRVPESAPAPQPSVNTTTIDGDQIQTSHAPGPDMCQNEVDEALAFAERDSQRLAVIEYDHPTPDQILHLASTWELHPLLVEDLLKAGQRPKLERYREVLFVVTRMATYLDEQEDVEVTEFHVLARHNAVVVIRQGRTREPIESFGEITHSPKLLRFGSEGILYSFLDLVVDGYMRVLRGVEVDREQIERQVFDGDPSVTERIYRLNREIIDLQQAAGPLREVLSDLHGGFSKYRTQEELQTYLQDVDDHLARVITRIDDLRSGMNQILDVNSILVTQQQNEDMKKISGWAAVVVGPTLIGSIYGMNFDVMPELHWRLGYAYALVLMVVVAAVIWLFFKRKKWM
ncbi:magnesium and cobalt transport protein CorA [Acidipropionibacterium virtanenii]|uniref:Cobalt/magnesium transport protein CorA n=1 Tax=Acidipropionibacterium virtanenii TaxID=2057246 RepID=A0A344UVJ0_9ACTN|nr:magnesium and cobalt transport protein CorA [Acidipropionibacterium virtanenii]AXE39288.1 Cobalt/magnesium transport protein CorA [Acidipropionibacterium virtanenii]